MDVFSEKAEKSNELNRLAVIFVIMAIAFLMDCPLKRMGAEHIQMQYIAVNPKIYDNIEGKKDACDQQNL